MVVILFKLNQILKQIKYYSFHLIRFIKMKENNKSNNNYHHLKPLFRKIRIVILLLPFLTIYSPLALFIYENCSVFINLFLLVLIYVGHQHHFHNFILDQSRKFLVSFLVTVMISTLVVQVQQIVSVVYQIQYGTQIVFWFRVIIVLSNLQGNIQLFEHPHRNKHKSHNQKSANANNEQFKENINFDQSQETVKVKKIQIQKNKVLIQQNQEMSHLNCDF